MRRDDGTLRAPGCAFPEAGRSEPSELVAPAPNAPYASRIACARASFASAFFFS